MSYISQNLKTDFEKIEHLFVTFFKKEPTWAAVAETDLAYIAPSIKDIVSLLGPSIEADASSIIESAEKDLVLATKFIQTLGADTADILGTLNSLESNLEGLISLSSVKGNSKINEITALVSSIRSEISIILSKIEQK
ncbi:Uncharacterised protein [uncultured archaeon]|nr:Uncharacterised protein [uncultured archaeon]